MKILHTRNLMQPPKIGKYSEGKFKAMNISLTKLQLHYHIFVQKILFLHKVKAG